jgi:PKD repeat protein
MKLFTYLLLLITIFVLAHPAACNEIAYAIGPNGEKAVGLANITVYKGTDLVSFTTSASPRGPTASYKAQRTVDFIKSEINKKINRGNEPVRDEGLDLVGSKSGAQRIDQICSIYDYMVGNWTFVSDPRGLDVFQYSNYTLKKGSEIGKSGKGDCDDFSILLAALVDSIGGTPRIILAYSPAGGHAYTEVYLGKMDDGDVDRILKWLRKAYNVNDVNIHADNVSGDVWLNMDWWKDTGGANRPGGPFYQAATQVPIYIQEDVPKTALTPIENKLPRPLFNYTPQQPEVDDIVGFDASGSSDPDGKIVDYEWNFGDGDTYRTRKPICQHIYSDAGKFQVNLTVTDNDGDKNIKTLEVNVKESLPKAIVTYSPINPQVGEAITFDASQSKDERGHITKYEWDFDDGNPGYKAIMKHRYEDSGAYNVNLTVTNDRGVKNSSSIAVVVSQKVETTKIISASHPILLPENETIAGVANLAVIDNEMGRVTKTTEVNAQEPLPEAIIAYSPINPQVGEVITFDASPSKDKRGQIIDYEWNFGDGYSGKGVSIDHQYSKSGTYNVALTVTNDRGIKNTSIITVVVGQKEKATEWAVPYGSPIVAAGPPSRQTFDKTEIINVGSPGQPMPQAVPPSPESLGLVIPQASLSSQSPPSSELGGFIATSKASAQAAAPSTQAAATAMVVPQGVYAPNYFYVPYSPSTTAGCNFGQCLPMWSDVRGTGPLYVYEWYPNGKLTTSNNALLGNYMGGYVSPGWQKNWFCGDVAGWHILQYYCGGWSNYVYIYVYGSN